MSLKWSMRKWLNLHLTGKKSGGGVNTMILLNKQLSPHVLGGPTTWILHLAHIFVVGKSVVVVEWYPYVLWHDLFIVSANSRVGQRQVRTNQNQGLWGWIYYHSRNDHSVSNKFNNILHAIIKRWIDWMHNSDKQQINNGWALHNDAVKNY